MQPVADTRRLLEALSSSGQPEVEASLLVMARRAQTLVPQCVGLSLTLVRENLTFTLVSTADEPARGGGEKVAAGAGQGAGNGAGPRPTRAERSSWSTQPLTALEPPRPSPNDEQAAVASSLSLPIVESDGVVARVTMYAATKAAFDGRLEMIAAALGASPRDASTDSDLAFRSRADARSSWIRFVEQVDVDVALGLLAATYDISLDQAGERLERAAQGAGVSRPQAARVVRHLR